jgi:hypothetical protein
VVDTSWVTIHNYLIGAIALGIAVVSPTAAHVHPHSQLATTAALTDEYVSPVGSDKATGTTASTPLHSLQLALNRAVPGVTIHLAPGAYTEQVTTKVNGTADLPITIEGTDTGFVPSARRATVLYGEGRIFTINNNYYHLSGFTINGEQRIPLTSYPSSLGSATAFKASVQASVVDSTMIFVGGSDTSWGLHGITVSDMLLNGAGGDCVRLRNNASYNTIIDSTIQWCGMASKAYGTDVFTYHNGEGVYVGTSPKSTDQPYYANDTSHGNVIQSNVIHTYGTECLDVKENAARNLFIDNDCADNTEPLTDSGSNIEVRGNDNSIIGNTVAGSMGYGLKLASDGSQYRQGGNVVENNIFSGDAGASIVNNQTVTQGTVCGNRLSVSSLRLASPSAPCP